MYEFINVIKFNGMYFEDGQVIAVTKKNGDVIIGSVLIKDYDGETVTSKFTLCLDTSKKFHCGRTFITPNEIENIQKVNK